TVLQRVEQIVLVIDRFAIDGSNHISQQDPPRGLAQASHSLAFGATSLDHVHDDDALNAGAAAVIVGVLGWQQGDAQAGSLHTAVGDQIRHDLPDDVDGDGKADAGAGTGGAVDGGVDPDQLSQG